MIPIRANAYACGQIWLGLLRMAAASATAEGAAIRNSRAGKPTGAAGERQEKDDAGEDGLSRTGTDRSTKC